MTLLIFKSHDVKKPGSRGAKYWRDEKGHVRYDEKPSEEQKEAKPYQYLVAITLSDRAKPVYIKPEPGDYDANGELSQAKVREIVNRELFGEYGFKDGKFWQKKGLLVEYKPRTTGSGKVVVDEIQRSGGYVGFEFRDSSVQRAYGKGLPKKITAYEVAPKDIDPKTGETTNTLPDKPDEAPLEGTADVPVDELGIKNVPKQKPMTEVAIGEPLKSGEDPDVIAAALLNEFLYARKPSQAKTPEGQAKARAERKAQFDNIVGTRKINPLPAWAVNKFDSPEELQHELGRANDMEWMETSHVEGQTLSRKRHAVGGRPLTTLITLGLWNPDRKTSDKRTREQLEKEWRPFIRRWARRYANVYASTDAYHKFAGAGSGQQFMRDRERDLYNQAVAILLHEADTYKSNDETGTIASRFDRVAENAIKSEMRRMSKEQALDLGATALEDLSEEESYHTPKTISPREYFLLRHLEPQAIDILTDAMTGLSPEERTAFETSLWIDDYRHSPDHSEERKYNEARARQEAKHGESRRDWKRPTTGNVSGVTSVASKMADTIVTLRGGKQVRLGDMTPQHQRYYVDRWFNDALAHISEHLKTPDGNVSSNGKIVEKWLRLEQKLAHVNRKDLEARAKLPVVQMEMPSIRDVETKGHPALTFFRNNRALAHKLGVADALDMPASLQYVKAPTNTREKETPYDRLTTYHKFHENLMKVPNITPVHQQAKEEAETAQTLGHWSKNEQGAAEWHEGRGVVAFHNAAVRAVKDQGDDAIKELTASANALGEKHPMVQEYMKRIALGDTPSNNDLAQWKAYSHSQYRDKANRLHVVEFVNEQRTKKSTVNDLMKAFHATRREYDRLYGVFL